MTDPEQQGQTPEQESQAGDRVINSPGLWASLRDDGGLTLSLVDLDRVFEPSGGEAHTSRIDLVKTEHLPKVERFVAHGDQTKIFDLLLTDQDIERNFDRPLEAVEKLKPAEV